ncbi:MAG: oligosaccharide flippase family protein, partial [Gammaproteobacteria bacterium]
IVGNVAFPVYAQVQDDRSKATRMFRRVLVATIALMIPVCAVFACLVPALVADLLGERWQGTVTVMQLLILSSVAGTLGDSVAPLLKGTGRPARIAWMDIVQFVVLIGAAWLFIDLVGLWGAGLAWVVSVMSTLYMAYRYAADLLDHPFRGVGPVLAAIIVTGTLASLVAVVILKLMSGIVAILAAAVGSAVAAALVIIALDDRFDLGLRSSLAEPFPWARRVARSWTAGN